MDLGSGLTLQTQTVGNKTTSGIYFMPVNTDNGKNKSKKKAEQTRTGINRTQSTKVATNQTNKKVLREKAVRNPSMKPKSEVTTKRSFVNAQKTEKANKKEVHSPNGMKENIPKSKPAKQQAKKYNANSNNSNNKTLQHPQQNVDPSYVTLTQDQLNTILSLVKTQHDINVKDVINVNKDQDSGEVVVSSGSRNTSKPGSGVSTRSRSNKNSASSRRTTASNGTQGGVLGLLQADENNETDVPSISVPDNQDSKSEEGVDQVPASPRTNVSPRPNDQEKIYTFSGTLMGLGSREQNKEKLDRNRKQYAEDLKAQMEKKRIAKRDSKVNSQKEETVLFGLDHHHYNQINSKHSAAEEQLETQKSTTANNTEPTRTPPPTSPSAATSSSKLHHQNENLPSAMRSSFFIGESGPRNHAFSAKKRQEQIRWREELEKQINEQKLKKASIKKQNKKADEVNNDEDLWFRHFDTMQHPANRVPSPPHIPSPRTTSTTVNNDDVTKPKSPAQINSHSQGDVTIERLPHNSDVTGEGDGGTISPSTSNHLRKMTSLLDPAEKDAIKLRRQKQEEHRRAIAEQVEERKRQKEEKERLLRLEEEEEERRLNEERINLQIQFEREKLSQKQKEELRDKKTRELYQQMQDAQASAMREKFEKRQKSLRRKGHDTSRLEKTHRSTLNTKNTVAADTLTATTNVIPPLNLDQIAAIKSNESQNNNNGDRKSGGRVIQVTSSDQGRIHKNHPISATINEEGGPIRLEISLTKSNNGSSLNNTKEMSVQTDFNNPTTTTTNHDISMVSDTTEYIPLPVSRHQELRVQPSARSHRDKSPQRKITSSRQPPPQPTKFDQNNLYDKYARQPDTNGVKKPKTKPKWGVGPKKKTYKPASQKYVAGQEWREKREENMKRREEQLLAQQALNERSKLIGKPTTGKSVTTAVAGENKINSQHHQQGSQFRQQRTKKNSHKPLDRQLEASSNDRRIISDHQQSVDMGPEEHVLPVKNNHNYDHLSWDQRPLSVTTQDAKYDPNKHSRASPVPETNNDFVEYRRSEAILNPNQPQSRPNSSKHIAIYDDIERPTSSSSIKKASNNGTIGSTMLKQRERQDRILKEISILRHGLLLKQREVANYPMVAMQTANNNVLLNNKNLAELTTSD